MRQTNAGSSCGLPDGVAEIVDGLFAERPDLLGGRDGLIKAYRTIVETATAGGILYVCGNGGSFADAMHIKGELAKSFARSRPIKNAMILERLSETELGKVLADELEQGLPVIVLGESHSLRSAYANDRNGTYAYAQELNAFVSHINHGVLLGISTSGNAENVVAATVLAKAYGVTTISFTGPRGGALAQAADVDWRVPGVDTPGIQENQVVLYHGLCKMIEVDMFG